MEANSHFHRMDDLMAVMKPCPASPKCMVISSENSNQMWTLSLTTKVGFFLLLVMCLWKPMEAASTQDDLFQVMSGLVLPHGYPLEEHFVTTQDGYILRNFRIPTGRDSEAVSRTGLSQEKPQLAVSRRSLRAAAALEAGSVGSGTARPVALLQHALLDSSVDYVFQGPDSSLAFMLADAGYDVWLTNMRGNRFSRNHTSLDPDTDADFWAFSWDQMAGQDLPAVVSYVTMVAGVQQVAYVGYSQGTTMAFAALSSQPLLAKRVAVAALMAPVAFLQHVTSVVLVASAKVDTDKLFELLGVMEFFPHDAVQSAATVQLCKVDPAVCIAYLAMLGGSDPSNVDLAQLPQFFRYFPAGTAVQNMAHWCQAIRQPGSTPFMAHFDYGQQCSSASGLPRRCNQDMYGQRDPPRYNLSSITTPLALFTGGHDSLADPQDISSLLAVLDPHTVVLHHDEPAYNHWDFGVGKDAHARVYPLVMELLDRYMKPANR